MIVLSRDPLPASRLPCPLKLVVVQHRSPSWETWYPGRKGLLRRRRRWDCASSDDGARPGRFRSRSAAPPSPELERLQRQRRLLIARLRLQKLSSPFSRPRMLSMNDRSYQSFTQNKYRILSIPSLSLHRLRCLESQRRLYRGQ